MTARRRRGPRLLAMHRAPAGPPPPDGEAAWMALRLYRVHRGEPVRTLEALAVAEANRLRAAGPRVRPLAGAPAPVEADGRYRTCLRTARRALAGTLADEVDGATWYHRREAEPRWARRLVPAVEIGGFLFYRREV